MQFVCRVNLKVHMIRMMLWFENIKVNNIGYSDDTSAAIREHYQ